jgi:hypothetical protein
MGQLTHVSGKRGVAVTLKADDRHFGWPAIIINVAAATAMSGAIAYVATVPERLAQAVAPIVPPAVAEPRVETVPVRYTNPFDSTEVFELPSGTSETEARRKVAELLAQRARERLNSWSATLHHQKKPGQLR